MFSIIVPYYKNLDIVRRCLDSVVNQTYRQFELLLVDDGSNDKIDDIVASYHDSRLRVLHKTNAGVASARNYGIKNATNEYICFLDSDDEWLLNHLEVLVEMMHKYLNRDFYITSYKRIGNTVFDSSELLPDTKSSIFCAKNLLKLYYEKGAIIHTNSVCLKKEFVVNLGGFNESVNIGEDTDLWLRCAIKTSPILSKSVTTVYYRDYSFLTKNRTHEYNWPFLDQYQSAIEDTHKKYYVDLICEKYILSSCKHLLSEGKKDESKKMFKLVHKPLHKEIKKNYYEVFLMQLIPKSISRIVGRKIYNAINSKY